MIRTAMQQKGMSQYRLSKISGIPYTTINDICNNRVKLEKCSAETVYRISQALDSLHAIQVIDLAIFREQYARELLLNINKPTMPFSLGVSRDRSRSLLMVTMDAEECDW